MNHIRETADKTKKVLEKKEIGMANFFITEKETHEFNVDGGEFSLFRTLYDNSLALTVFQDQKKGSYATNHLDDASIEKAVDTCLSSAQSGVADPAYAIAPMQEPKVFHEGAYEPDIELFFERTRELMRDIGARYPKILMEQMIVSHEKIHSIYQDTNGNDFEVLKGQYNISLMFSAHDGDQATSFCGSDLITDRLDVPFLECGSLAKDLADAEAQLELVPLDGKFEGTILLTPSCLGSFLGDILSNFAGSSVILEKTSIWLDKLEQKVADDRLTIGLSPLDPRIVCGQRCTEDGLLAENYNIIENGVLKAFMLPLYVANKTGFAPAKNTSSAVVIEGGDTPYSDMIKHIKKGLIVGRFSGGEPGTNGDFSGVAKNSFLIEDGVIRGAVSETMINGNLAELLNSITDISKETVCDGTSVLPYIAFDHVVISGK